MAHIPPALLGIGKLQGDRGDVTVGTREHLQTPPHTHPTTNHVLVTDGVLYLTLDGVERPVCAGEWCTIPANAEHAERFEDKTSVVVFWIREAAA